jgi:hypothetical protein
MSKATRERDAILGNLERGQIRKTGSTDQSKRLLRDQAFFQQGAAFGAQMRMHMLHNSVRGLDYGAAYYVPPTVSVPVDGSDLPASDDLPVLDPRAEQSCPSS